MNKIIPIVLAGGIGSRLWPLSQESHPKQFLKLFSDKSLFQLTLIRNKKFGTITVITNEAYKNIVLEQSREIDIEIELIIEPVRKNTAPSFLAAAFHYLKIENVFLLFLPTDHYINGENEYHLSLEQAIYSSNEHNFITIGIKPKSSNPNYGYIKKGLQIADNIYYVKNFKEKPTQSSTNKYVSSNNYFWNSGIYLVNAKYLLDRSQIIQESLYSYIYDSYNLGVRIENSFYLARKPYEKILPVSFDYAIVEHIQNILLITANFGWHDLGSWDSICSLLINGQNNYCVGDVILKTLINSYFNSKKSPQLLDSDAEIINCTANEPEIFLRKWGYYQILVNSNSYKIKELIIHPGRQLSMQYHFHRIEFWVVIKGIGEIIIGSKNKLEKKIIKENDFVDIPVKTIHQLINIGKIDLQLIETQVGRYLEESDIVRLNED